MASLRERLLKNNPWRVILLAVLLLIAGELILVWQYRRLEEGRVSELEKRLEEQAQTIEERAAQETLRTFLEARVAGDENKASRYVTEQTMLQRQQGLFEFLGIQDYAIQSKEKFGEGIFRFQVEITRDRLKQLELIELQKISDEYYVNSVQLAG